MSVDTKKLVKDWIQFLKNNQIVAMQSDGGKLQYKREVTSSDITKFLEIKTAFTSEQISNAIHIVMSKNASGNNAPKISDNPSQSSPDQNSNLNPSPSKPGNDVSTWMHNGMRPVGATNRISGEPSKLSNHSTSTGQDKSKSNTPNEINYDPNSISDIDYKDIPNKQQNALSAPSPTKSKPKFKLRTKGLKEDFDDNEIFLLSEQDVEQIFNVLTGNSSQSQSDTNTTEQPDSQALNKIKRVIRDTMTDAQRKALWRALNGN